MPKIVKVRNYSLPDLLNKFTSQDISPASGNDLGSAQDYTYESSDDLKLWIRFNSGNPVDLVNYDPNNIPTIVYEGTEDTQELTVFSKRMKSANFSDDNNKNSLLTFPGPSGNNNIITFGDGATYDLPFSVSFWFRKIPDLATDNTDYLFTKGKSTSTLEYAGWYTPNPPGSDLLVFNLYGNGSSTDRQTIIATGTPIIDYQWHHIAFTYDGTGGLTAYTGMKIYVDGEELSTTDYNNGSYVYMDGHSEKLYIGARYDGTYEADGNMAEFAIWSKELSANEIKAIYNETYEGAVVKSGYTNLPPRVRLREIDNRPGCYPTKHRMGDKDRSGKNNIFYEDLPIQFGSSIYDDFENIETPGGYADETNYDAKKWTVSSGMSIKTETVVNTDGTLLTDKCAVFSGVGTGGKRYIQSVKKIINPTRFYFELIQGPYNQGPNGLDLIGLPLIATTSGIKVEISSDSAFTSPITIMTILPALQNSFYGIEEGFPLPVQRRKRVTLGLSDFSGLTEPYYFRFVQENYFSNSSNWAIANIEVEYADQDVRYPLLLNHQDYAGSKFANSLIALPHTSGTLTGVGRSVKGVSDLTNPFQDFSETISAFDETLAIENTSLNFFNEGLDPDIYPGFTSPTRSKTKFTIDFPCQEKIEFGYVDAIQSVNANFQTDTSGIGQKLMIYYNKDLKRWEKIGHPIHINNVTSPSAETFAQMMSQSCVGFGSSIETFSKGIANGTSMDIDKFYDKSFLKMSNKKITDFNFPFGQQYFASSSHILKAKDIGITKPFLLEKASLNFSASFFFGFDNATNDHNELFSLKMLDRTDPAQSIVKSAGVELIVPTFFILRQFKDNATLQNQDLVANTNDYGFNASTSFTLPVNATLDFDNPSNITRVDSNRELITYGQLGLFMTGTDSSAPGKDNSFRINGTSIGPSKIIESGLSFDENRIIEWSGDPAPNGRRSEGAVGKFTINFPSRINTLVKKENSVMRMGLASVNVYRDQLFLTNNFTYNNSDLKNSRRIVNGTSSQIKSGFLDLVPNLIDSEPPIIISSPKENEKISPYVILPEDELIFGWQYPLATNPGKHSPGAADDNYGTSRMYHMRLFDNSRLHLYGSEVVQNKEFHETVNQNLTSCAVYEHVIGDEKVLDQWQVAYRGELTGSTIGQTIVNSNNILKNNDNHWKYAYSNELVFDTTTEFFSNSYKVHNNFYPSNKEQIFKRIGITSYSIVGGKQGLIDIFVNSGQSESTARAITKTIFDYAPGLQVGINLRDNNRIFKDSTYIIGQFYDDSEYGTINAPNVRSLSSPFYIGAGLYDSTSNLRFYNDLRPKYTFSFKHFGYYADMLQQGKDSKFNFVDTQNTEGIGTYTVAVSSVPPVQARFVSKSISEIGDVIYTEKTIDYLTEFKSFQSSNLSQFMTSSMPFIDNDTVTNRSYIQFEYIGFNPNTLNLDQLID